jgi:hypothetical protein
MVSISQCPGSRFSLATAGRLAMFFLLITAQAFSLLSPPLKNEVHHVPNWSKNKESQLRIGL